MKAKKIIFMECYTRYERIFASEKYFNLQYARIKDRKKNLISVEEIEITEYYNLLYNDKVIFTGATENECLFYLHDNTANSWDYNLKYGYKIMKVNE